MTPTVLNAIARRSATAFVRYRSTVVQIQDVSTVIDETRGEAGVPEEASGAGEGTSVFLDLDTVLLATHPGKYGPELGLQACLAESIGRLAEVADVIVVVVDPSRGPHRTEETAKRISVLANGLGPVMDRLIIATCPHDGSVECDCSKPQSGLIRTQLEAHNLPSRSGWYVAGDQEGVVAGRNAGLQTIRIGPLGSAAEDHLSVVHRPDHEARDLMDAANRMMLEVLEAG